MKPKLCEILNLNVGQVFRLDPDGPKFYVSELGYIHELSDNRAVCGIAERAINHPDQIIRETSLSQHDMEWIRALNLILPEVSELICEECGDAELGMSDLVDANYVVALDGEKHARLMFSRKELNGYLPNFRTGETIRISEALMAQKKEI